MSQNLFVLNQDLIKYLERLSKLELKPLSIRRKLKILKYAFKYIYNDKEVPLIWKNKFSIENINTRNSPLLNKIHTRIQFCDKNFFIYAINLFITLPIDVRTEKRFKTFMSLSETLLLNIF